MTPQEINAKALECAIRSINLQQFPTAGMVLSRAEEFAKFINNGYKENNK